MAPEALVTTPFVIRAVEGADLEAVEATVSAAGLPLDGLRDQFGDGYAVAVAGGAIIGVEGVEIHGRHGLLRSAAVAGAWRGHGVGDALTRDRIAWARRRGLQSLFLLTTTAGEYFPRFGFAVADRDAAPEPVKRSREFADACPSTALFMQLDLQS